MNDQTSIFDKPKQDIEDERRRYPSLQKFRFHTLVEIGRAREMNQDDLVRMVMKSASDFYVCASFFYGDYLPNGRNSISNLRLAGATIWSHTCEDGEHNHRQRSRLSTYRWVSE